MDEHIKLVYCLDYMAMSLTTGLIDKGLTIDLKSMPAASLNVVLVREKQYIDGVKTVEGK